MSSNSQVVRRYIIQPSVVFATGPLLLAHYHHHHSPRAPFLLGTNFDYEKIERDQYLNDHYYVQNMFISFVSNFNNLNNEFFSGNLNY